MAPKFRRKIPPDKVVVASIALPFPEVMNPLFVICTSVSLAETLIAALTVDAFEIVPELIRRKLSLA